MKKLKGLCITFIIVVLAVVMALGTTTISVFGAKNTAAVTTAETFYSKFIYGDTYDFGNSTDVTVTAPDGQAATLANGKLKADQLGAYTVKYSNYSYNVKCVMDKEYELRVDHGGADIATYMAKDSKLIIPTASLWLKNDKGEFEKTSQEVNYIVDGLKDSTDAAGVANAVKEITIANVGTYNVHYFAEVLGGKKYISQDFEVKVQSTFKDETKPTLTVVNMPSKISLKTKVTLPTATVTDNYDKNVRVDVKVEMLNSAGVFENVKVVTANNDGYGETIGTEDVVFDNKYNMSFYPMEKTEYRITYTAVDDIKTNVTTPKIWTQVMCVDSTAPILKDIEDSQIPTKWGYNTVTRALAGETGNVNINNNPYIVFPYPTYIDNTTDNISVSFEIKDTVNNQVVLKIENIYATDGVNNKYTFNENSASNGIYPDTLTFTNDGLKDAEGKGFDFRKYVSKLGTDKTKTGDYTVTYQARDTKPNFSPKVYTINLAENFTDKEVPVASVKFENDYLVVTEQEEDFTVPSLITSDNETTRLGIKYALKSGANEILVDGGESAKLQLKKVGQDTVNKPYLTVTMKDKTEQTLLLAGSLSYDVVVTDDVGNKIELTQTEDKKVKILDSSAFTNFNDVLTVSYAKMTDTNALDPNGYVQVGGFEIDAVMEGMREFIGFEMSLTDSKNNLLSTNVNFTTYFDKVKGTNGLLSVENINFKPSKTDVYTLYVRVFDVTGRSTVNSFVYDVTVPTTDGGPEGNAIKIPTSGNVYTTYQLKNNGVKLPGCDHLKVYVVRQVTASGKFSIMGTKFTAYTSGTFEFEDGYYKDQATTVTPLDNNGSYDLTVSETQTPVWEMQGKMPSFSAKDEKIELPSIVANAGYNNAEVTLSVTTPSGNTLKVAKTVAENDESDVKISETTGKYEFVTKEEGSYSINYSAIYGDNQPINTTYTIKSGDTIAPDFKLVKTHDTRATEKGKFKFSKVEILSTEDFGTDEIVKSVRYVKKLIAPNGDVVYEVDETGKDGRDREIPTGKEEYVFNSTGTYTVEYTVYDKAGNPSVQKFDINVVASKTTNVVSTKIISTVLIIVGVLLIAGVILYFVRFRKVKTGK